MVTFKFDLTSQEEQYKKVKEKLKTQFYQNLHFYVLPYMPEKFRNRVVYLPEVCEPEKIYTKHRIKINLLETEWNKTKSKFIKKLQAYFSEVKSLNILISPQLYGTVGSYGLQEDKIIVRPRYDRSLIGLQKLIITALVHYFKYYKHGKDAFGSNIEAWKEKQELAGEIENNILELHKKKSLVKMLDTEFAGKLAEESAKYLEKLKVSSKIIVNKPQNLTKSETIVFNLLLRNKNKLVSFDEIANWLWEDKSVDKFSEYAITKLIERLKKKLPKNVIHSQRGTGYVLHI